MRIISLSSIPPRFPFLKPTLESLVSQQNVDEVRLYIPKTYRRFPEYDGNLPSVPDGVIICQIEDDLGPATKILPATRDFRNQDVQILFCDDDSIFPVGWAERLFKAQGKRKFQAVATYGRDITYGRNISEVSVQRPRAKKIRIEYDLPYRTGRLLTKLFGVTSPLWRPIIYPGYVDMLFGVSGVVVRPDFFDDEAFNIPDEAWPVDDIWLSAQLARKNIPIYCPWRFPCPRSGIQSSQDALLDAEFAGLTRQESNRKAAFICQHKYGIWK
ncbi:MAG: hypothetical protein Q8M03_14400 [Legionella sp.]|nr:hypothetical protein [Legionella sp.]